MPGTLRLADRSTVPIDLCKMFAGSLDGQSWSALPSRTVYVGGDPQPARDVFEFIGDASDGQLILEGELARVVHIGAEMTSGQILVRGDAGPCLGRRLAGGIIEVEGSAAIYVGAGMTGGEIVVRGNVGNELGSGEPGLPGMNGGTIYVCGNAGHFAGRRMRRGLIAIAGSIGMSAMSDAVAGTMIVQGASGEYPGAGMRRGTLLLLERLQTPLLPTFARGRAIEPLFLTILLRQWRHDRIPLDVSHAARKFTVYHGDLLQRGLGEILVPAE